MTRLEKQLQKERRLLYRRRVSISDFVRQVIFSGMSLAEVTQRVRCAVIAEVLHRTGGNQCQAARLLNIHRNTLARQIECGRKSGMLEVWDIGKRPSGSENPVSAREARA